jgi:hypothetical protein
VHHIHSLLGKIDVYTVYVNLLATDASHVRAAVVMKDGESRKNMWPRCIC